MSIKFLVLGGVFLGLGGGGNADFIFMGAGTFLIKGSNYVSKCENYGGFVFLFSDFCMCASSKTL